MNLSDLVKYLLHISERCFSTPNKSRYSISGRTIHYTGASRPIVDYAQSVQDFLGGGAIFRLQGGQYMKH